MMRLFRQYLIGGASGSREGTWFLVLTLVVGPVNFVMIAEFLGVAMATTSGLLMVVGPAVVAAWVTAHGLEKAKQAGWVAPRPGSPPPGPE